MDPNRFRPRTHGRGTRRAKHIEFLGQFSPEAAEELGGTRAPIEQRGNREHVLYFLAEVLVGFLGPKLYTRPGFSAEFSQKLGRKLNSAEETGRVYRASMTLSGS